MLFLIYDWASGFRLHKCTEAYTSCAAVVDFVSWDILLTLSLSLSLSGVDVIQVMRNDEWDKSGGVGCGMSGDNC